MLDLPTFVVAAAAGSAWFGFFLERGYKQSATYNLIGKASKLGISKQRVDAAIENNFNRSNWMLLALSFFAACIAIYCVYAKVGSRSIIAGLSAISGVLFILCLRNLSKYYMRASNNLS